MRNKIQKFYVINMENYISIWISCLLDSFYQFNQIKKKHLKRKYNVNTFVLTHFKLNNTIE